MSARLGDLASIELSTDVLVIGGGPAGTWAALAAAAEGRKVVLADKGYCGTSGATAPSGVGVWYVPPDPEAREEARASRERWAVISPIGVGWIATSTALLARAASLGKTAHAGA